LRQNGGNLLRRILVIEDQQSIRMMLSVFLSETGYNVEVAENGEEGIQLFNSHPDLDLVITDIRMPKVDGNEVARHIRDSHRANTPLVAITGFAEEAYMELFDYILEKPFKLETLSNVLAQFKPMDQDIEN
jgi:CheY-like chemotaxis protein